VWAHPARAHTAHALAGGRRAGRLARAGLIPADGEIWRTRRRAIVPALHRRYIESMVGMFGDSALHGARTLQAAHLVRRAGAPALDLALPGPGTAAGRTEARLQGLEAGQA